MPMSGYRRYNPKKNYISTAVRYGTLTRGPGKRRIRHAQMRDAQLVAKAYGIPYSAGFLARNNLRTAGFNRSVEKKYYDNLISIVTCTAAGNVLKSAAIDDTMIGPVQIGTADNQRIGRKITLRNVNCHLLLTLPATTNGNDSADSVRIIVAIDKQCNAAAPPLTTIFEQASDMHSFRDMQSIQRYDFLYDKMHDINATAGGGDGTTIDTFLKMKKVNMYLKCNYQIMYAGTAGTVADLTSNNLFILVISEAGKVKVEGTCRIRYQDS